MVRSKAGNGAHQNRKRCAAKPWLVRVKQALSPLHADIVATHKKGIYIFELKVGEPVDRAFKQIHEKKYAKPYLAADRPI